MTNRTLRLGAIAVCSSVLLLAVPSNVFAQTPAAAANHPLRFEVASVRPSANPEAGSNRNMLPGGRFVATATPVRTFLRNVFGNDEVRLPSGSGWVDDATFDVEATTVGHEDVRTPEQFQQVIQSLLEERFGLKFHREQKDSSIYWLVLDKPGKIGPDLKPSGPDSKPSQSNSGGERIQMHMSAVSMSDVAASLTRQAGRRVEDHTGLAGKYDFDIEWASQLSTDATGPSLYTALKDRLGLRLQSEKGSAEVIVVDQITKPTEN